MRFRSMATMSGDLWRASGLISKDLGGKVQEELVSRKWASGGFIYGASKLVVRESPAGT